MFLAFGRSSFYFLHTSFKKSLESLRGFTISLGLLFYDFPTVTYNILQQVLYFIKIIK